MKMLFIGGSQDGKEIEVPDKMNFWKVTNLSKVPVSAYDKGTEIPITAPTGTAEEYRRVGISLCDMMVVGTMSVGEVIPKLMCNYRPEVKYDKDTFREH